MKACYIQAASRKLYFEVACMNLWISDFQSVVALEAGVERT